MGSEMERGEGQITHRVYRILRALAFTPRDVGSHRGFVSKGDMIREATHTRLPLLPTHSLYPMPPSLPQSRNLPVETDT